MRRRVTPTLINTGAPPVDNRFIITIKSDNAGTSNNDQFTIQTFTTSNNYDVETSDGYTATGLIGNHTITFPSGAGTHTVFITGLLNQLYYNNTGDRLKLLSIENWGIYGELSTSQSDVFEGCTNLEVNTTSICNISNAIFLTRMFRDVAFLNNLPKLNTSFVTTFTEVFRNTDISTFDYIYNFSNATNLARMFQDCTLLTTFPANVFDTCPSTNYAGIFTNTALTQISIDNVLVSINTAGQSNGTFNQSGGSAPSTTGENAIDALRLRGWTITVTGGY